MKRTLLFLLSLCMVVAAWTGCCKDASLPAHIELVYFKPDASRTTLVSPNWKELVEGRYPRHRGQKLVRDAAVCDSILLYMHRLRPMLPNLIPSFSYPSMQCDIRRAGKRTTTLILYPEYMTLNGRAMYTDMPLKKMLEKECGYPVSDR